VAYFFGEIDEESDENVNKHQHSKLLITRLIVLVCGYLLAIAASGMPLGQLTIVIGALGVGIGLGLQNIVNNFVSGVILIFDRPIQVGDVIEVSSASGRVKTIGLRSTKIDTSNGAEIIIPNGNLLSQNITNWTYTDNLKLVEIAFGITGQMTHETVKETVTKTLQSLPLISAEKAPVIYYSSMADNHFQLLVKFWCSIYRTEEAISSARHSLFDNFKAQGVSLTA
jgi:small-conductance mechanosensitive channel